MSSYPDAEIRTQTCLLQLLGIIAATVSLCLLLVQSCNETTAAERARPQCSLSRYVVHTTVVTQGSAAQHTRTLTATGPIYSSTW